jgi:hypothetical protein
LVLLWIAALAACTTEPDYHAVPLAVSWLEWPAEVRTAVPFGVRLAGYIPCGTRLVPSSRSDTIAVSFEPYALVPNAGPPCIPIVPTMFDDTVVVPGLAAASARLYQIRVAMLPDSSGVRPYGTVGEITVQPETVTVNQVSAVGFAEIARDPSGCLRVHPITRLFATSYVLENPPDTTSSWSAAVRGYLYDAAAPLCGETRVFHLVSRN